MKYLKHRVEISFERILMARTWLFGRISEPSRFTTRGGRQGVGKRASMEEKEQPSLQGQTAPTQQRGGVKFFSPNCVVYLTSLGAAQRGTFRAVRSPGKAKQKPVLMVSREQGLPFLRFQRHNLHSGWGADHVS